MDTPPIMTRWSLAGIWVVTFFVLYAAALLKWSSVSLWISSEIVGVIATILVFTAMWLDYRSGVDRSALRHVLAVCLVIPPVQFAAKQLTEAYDLGSWLMISAMVLLFPLMWFLFWWLDRRQNALR